MLSKADHPLPCGWVTYIILNRTKDSREVLQYMASRLELPTGSFPRVSSLTAQGPEVQFQLIPGAPARWSTLQILDLPSSIIAFANSLTSLSVYGHILVVLFLWRVLDNKGLIL